MCSVHLRYFPVIELSKQYSLKLFGIWLAAKIKPSEVFEIIWILFGCTIDQIIYFRFLELPFNSRL